MRSSRYTPSAYGDIDSGGWDNPPPRSNHSSQGYNQGRETTQHRSNYNPNGDHKQSTSNPPRPKSNDSWEPVAAPITAPRSEYNSFQAKEPVPPPSRFDQPQHRASRYEEEEDLDEEEEYTAPAAEPVYGSYVAWTGVT